MKTIVLSAFGVFGKYIANSTQILAKAIGGTDICGYGIRPHVLSACIPAYDRGAGLLYRARDLNAAGIISLGMSSTVSGPTVERRAVNIVNSKYCTSGLNGQRVSDDHPSNKWFDTDLGGWNVDAFLDRCHSKGIRASQSDNPGTFCCNHLMLQVHLAKNSDARYAGIPVIYIHLPCTKDCVSNPDDFLSSGKQFMDLEDMVAAMRILLETSSLA